MSNHSINVLVLATFALSVSLLVAVTGIKFATMKAEQRAAIAFTHPRN